MAEPEYQEIVTKRRLNVIILHRLARKICNSLTSVVEEDVLGNLIEYLYSLMMVRGEDYESLPKYLEVLKHR